MLHQHPSGDRARNPRIWSRSILAIVVALLLVRTSASLPIVYAQAQTPAAGNGGGANVPVAARSIGQFVTLSPTIDAAEYGRLNRIAKNLSSKAKEQKQPGILILEIVDGTSRFGDLREVAKLLSEEVPDLRTVAWIPKDVRGYNVIAALACNEIIMHPQAGLGDLGRGKPVDEDVKTYVDILVSRRHNPLLSSALVRGMMDPAEEVIWVRRQTVLDPKVPAETELVTPVQFQRLLDAKAVIVEHKTIKAAGSLGLFTGRQARAGGYLCTQTADARVDIAGIYNLPRESLRVDATLGADLVPRRIKIQGVITPLIQEFIHRQIERMMSEGANLIIFEVDSPGGYLNASVALANVIAELDPKKVRTVAYIPHQALSGAAIISLGCDDIVLHPTAQIGDSAPIEVQEDGAFGRAPEKVLGIVRDMMNQLATRKGRPPAIAIAMADRNYEVFKVRNRSTGEVNFLSESDFDLQNELWIKEGRVDESGRGNLLTVNGKLAHEYHIAEPPVDSFDELKIRYGIPANESVPAVGPTWVDSLVFTLNDSWVTGFLFVIGVICIYAELHVPSGLFMIISCVCFGLFFWSRLLGGTAGWLEVMLFLLGLGFIAMEVFVMPGFGVFGVSGGLMVLSSLVLASQTFFIPTSSSDYRELAEHLRTLGGSLVGVVITAMVLSRFLPRMPLLNRIVLVPPGSPASRNSGPQLRPDLASDAGYPFLDAGPFAGLLGMRGRTMTILRPSGKAFIEDRIVDVVSDGPFIEAEQPIQVIEVNGNRIVVRSII